LHELGIDGLRAPKMRVLLDFLPIALFLRRLQVLRHLRGHRRADGWHHHGQMAIIYALDRKLTMMHRITLGHDSGVWCG
jgi:hypothetical protein